VLDRFDNPEDAPQQQRISLTGTADINEFFERVRDIELRERKTATPKDVDPWQFMDHLAPSQRTPKGDVYKITFHGFLPEGLLKNLQEEVGRFDGEITRDELELKFYSDEGRQAFAQYAAQLIDEANESGADIKFKVPKKSAVTPKPAPTEGQASNEYFESTGAVYTSSKGKLFHITSMKDRQSAETYKALQELAKQYGGWSRGQLFMFPTPDYVGQFNAAAKELLDKPDIVFSKANTVSGQIPKGIPVSIAQREADKMLSKLQGAAGIRVKVLKTKAEAESLWKMQLNGDAVRGAYSKRTRTAYVIAENLRGMRDLQHTLAHELIAHGGLDTVIGADQYQDFLDKIIKTRGIRQFQPIWQQIDKDYEKSSEREKAEEVFAHYAQYQPVEPAIKLWWTALKRWLAKALQAVGFMEAGAADFMDDMLLSIRQGFAVGKVRQGVKDALAFQLTGSSRLGMHFKDVVKRVPELQAAAKKLQAGELSAADYDQLVNEYKPVTPYDSIPSLASLTEMQKALDSNKVGKIGAPFKDLQDGDFVGLRLDIPAYSNHGVWVVSVHEGKKGGKGGAAGKVIGYDSAAMVKNPNMGMAEKSTLQIAAGASKGTIATIGGAWVSKSPAQIASYAEQVLSDKAWVQVGMDPERHSYFYDRATMKPVVSGDEAIQVGGLVLVKNPVYGSKDDFLFDKTSVDAKSVTESPAFKRWFGKSKVVNADGSPQIVYHGGHFDVSEFSEFDPDFLDEENDMGRGFYFTSNRADAEGYDYNRDYDEPQVLDVYLSMQNPYYIGESPKPAGFSDESGEEFRAAVQAAGYDGIIDRTVNAKFMESEGYSPDAVHYVVFEPTQIKSAVDNNGDFDISDPDIHFSKSDVEQTGNPIMDAVASSMLNACSAGHKYSSRRKSWRRQK